MCKAVETISLSDFLCHGELGSIKTGMSLKQFYNIMGKPDDISLTRLPIWKYGTVEFEFSNAKDSPILDFIGIYFQNHNSIPMSFPSRFCLNQWWPNDNTTLDEFLFQIKELSIPVYSDELLTFDTQVAYRTLIGVGIVFDVRNSNVIIDSMQYRNKNIAENREENSL